MYKLFIYCKSYKKEMILGPFFKLLEALFELCVPLILAKIIDIGIAQHHFSYIIKLCCILLFFGFFGFLSSITAQYFSAKASVGFVQKMRDALFSHIQQFSYSQLDDLGSATLLTRMTSDSLQVQNGMNLALRLLLRSPIVVFGATFFAISIDAKLSIIFIITLIVLTAVISFLLLYCIPKYQQVQQQLDHLFHFIQDHLHGIRILRAFCKEQEELATFEQKNQSLTFIQKHVAHILSLMDPLTYWIVQLATIALLWFGAIRVHLGILSQGAIIALYNYLTQILVELIKFVNLMIQITKSIACGNRIQQIFAIVPENPLSAVDCPKTFPGGIQIQFKDVSFRYADGCENALTHLSFSVPTGGTLGIIGGTGSGKSSLLQLLLGCYPISDGQILWNNIPIEQLSIAQLRKQTGIVPQKCTLFAGSVRENIRWGKRNATDKEIFHALTIAQANDFIAAKKEGLDFVIEQNGRNLSGGQRQRLCIARALIKQPNLLLFDDCFSALDAITNRRLRDALSSLPYHPTMILVSQRITSLRHADQILVLDNGRAVGFGTASYLEQHCTIYQEMLVSQTGKDA